MRISFINDDNNSAYIPQAGDWFKDSNGLLYYCYNSDSVIPMAYSDGNCYNDTSSESLEDLNFPFEFVGRIEHYEF